MAGKTTPGPDAKKHLMNPLAKDAVTLRDYFAVSASEDDVHRQGEVIRSEQVACSGTGILEDGWQIRARYMHADAMLRIRAV
jgi:hypothetical protein